MFLYNDNIILRPVSRQDLNDEYLLWLNDQETCAQNSHAYFPYTMDQLIKHYESKLTGNQEIRLAIVLKEENVHVGNVSLQNINWINRSAEFAILLGHKKYWGKGIGYMASLLIMDHGFRNLNLHRIYCGTTSGNISMNKIAEKIGMKKEGIRREAFFKNGSFQDVVEYGILKHEFEFAQP